MAQAQQQETGLESHGITNVARVYWNLTVPALYEEAVRRREASISVDGPLVCRTGQHTGRSPNDKFIVREPSSEEKVWWSNVNRAIDAQHFDAVHQQMLNYCEGKELFVQDCYAGADDRYRLPVRIITEQAWHSLFARHMFIEAPDAVGGPAHTPQFTVIDMPGFTADPKLHGTNSEVFILLNFAKKLVLIGGTSYAGEIKKSIFTVMNYLLPLRNVMSMHCSANVGPAGDVALFFGLSGTGKTTLSSDPERQLIGDDEHGWSEEGVFNIEGGCYAKTIKLSSVAEPEIYKAVHTFGTILENVTVDERGVVDLDDDSKTENTRAAYELEQIPNAHPSKMAGHPRNVVFLTADAFGILPPLARLSRDQAQYWFLSGFTAKLAGTEIGVTEPQPTFSTCFGQPFIPQFPSVYASMLADRLEEHGATVWLVNTGWTGGPFGEGHRMPIDATRALLAAALSGGLVDAEYRVDPVFGFEVPVAVPGVDSALLDPRGTWSDPAAYDAKAAELAGMFRENFERRFAADVEPAVAAAGPRG